MTQSRHFDAGPTFNSITAGFRFIVAREIIYLRPTAFPWGDLPTSMKEAIDEFRVQLGAAIDSVEFVKRALDRQVPETSWKATEQR
jgi:hypothetical protein